MGKLKVRFGYCDYCEKEIKKPAKKELDEMEKTIFAIVIISTLGVAMIISGIMIIILNPLAIIASLITIGIGILTWQIYTKVIRRKLFCPTCSTKLKFSKEAFTKPEGESEESEPATPRERVLERVEETKDKSEEEEEEKKIFCTFCGHELKEEVATCPYCKTALKF